MASRAEITVRYAREYRGAAKTDKSRLLGQAVAVTGWSRDNARRRLRAAARPRTAMARKRRDTDMLAASMRALLGAPERHGELA